MRHRLHLLALATALLACGKESTSTPDAAPPATAHERLYVGTGEYDGKASWHGILRFEGAEAIDGKLAPNATIPVKQVTDGSGTHLNFGHGLYLHERRDELFVSTLFTRADNSECSPCDPKSPAETGSIGVIGSASSSNGAQKLVRHIFGGDDPVKDATQLNQPHGLWIDEKRDLLYVANTFGQSVLVFSSASTADGNVRPARRITSQKLGFPVFVFVDSAADRMFVASMGAGPLSKEPSVLVYRAASTLDGVADPPLRIVGPSTRLGTGNNQTTHNVWWVAEKKLLLVAHHTNEVLLFDLADVDLDAPGPLDRDLSPRVIDVSDSDATVPNHSVYGLFYLPENDRLYVSVGFARGGPNPGTPPNAVKVYDGVSARTVSGRVAPARLIHWTNGDVYFPPQPLWVTRY